jgi:hypothetical protein
MADNPNKKKKDSKQVSQQEHEQRYQLQKKSGSGNKKSGAGESKRSK